jgi:hypothetical protein
MSRSQQKREGEKMEVKDLLKAAQEALDEVDVIEDKPLIDYAAACALAEIAYQLRRIVHHMDLAEEREEERLRSVYSR